MRKTILLLGGALLLAAPAVQAGGKHLVELFTSQGCFSCPPAERLLGDLIESRSDIVALEFHVDYWNDLVYGLAGKWTDPFSKNEYTQRQKRYRTRGLEGNNGVYTPQTVVNGSAAVAGSKKNALERLLDTGAPAAADVAMSHTPGSMRIQVSGDSAGVAEVWLYTFDKRTVTKVRSGENKGKTLTNHHVVREARRIGEWQGNESEYVLNEFRLKEGQGCAVVIQREEQGPVLGAAVCPS